MSDSNPLSGPPPLRNGRHILDALPADSATASTAVLDALPVEEARSPRVLPPPLPVSTPRGGFFRRLGRGLLWCIRGTLSGIGWLFGLVSLLVGLAFLAAVPLLQFLSLGYLLEAGARVARSGRFREGFIGVRLAGRLGGIVLGSWLLLLPVRYVSSVAQSAQILDPGGRIARNWRLGLLLLIGFTALHIFAACARGGKLRYFVWPFNLFWLMRRLFRGGYYAEARDAVWDTVVSLRLPYYFSLGFRGFMGAMTWLAIPITLLALGRAPVPIAPLVGFLGALILGIVLLYLPFLQMHLATENRLSAIFELRTIRRAYLRAPWAFTFALFMTLALAIPLYLLKIEIVPQEAAWLPSLVFILFIYPARLLTGWAMSRSRRREESRHWFFRWTGRLPLVPVVAFYVIIVYFTQFTSWNGVWSLYEQHAFLVPVPFFSM